jgi:hypothetical protein
MVRHLLRNSILYYLNGICLNAMEINIWNLNRVRLCFIPVKIVIKVVLDRTNPIHGVHYTNATKRNICMQLSQSISLRTTMNQSRCHDVNMEIQRLKIKTIPKATSKDINRIATISKKGHIALNFR